MDFGTISGSNTMAFDMPFHQYRFINNDWGTDIVPTKQTTGTSSTDVELTVWDNCRSNGSHCTLLVRPTSTLKGVKDCIALKLNFENSNCFDIWINGKPIVNAYQIATLFRKCKNHILELRRRQNYNIMEYGESMEQKAAKIYNEQVLGCFGKPKNGIDADVEAIRECDDDNEKDEDDEEDEEESETTFEELLTYCTSTITDAEKTRSLREIDRILESSNKDEDITIPPDFFREKSDININNHNNNTNNNTNSKKKKKKNQKKKGKLTKEERQRKAQGISAQPQNLQISNKEATIAKTNHILSNLKGKDLEQTGNWQDYVASVIDKLYAQVDYLSSVSDSDRKQINKLEAEMETAKAHIKTLTQRNNEQSSIITGQKTQIDDFLSYTGNLRYANKALRKEVEDLTLKEKHAVQAFRTLAKLQKFDINGTEKTCSFCYSPVKITIGDSIKDNCVEYNTVCKKCIISVYSRLGISLLTTTANNLIDSIYTNTRNTSLIMKEYEIALKNSEDGKNNNTNNNNTKDNENTTKAAELEKRKEDETLCNICFEEKKNMLLSPCNHICVCETCSKNIKQCPLCRKVHTSILKVFI